MKLLIVLVALVAVCVAAVTPVYEKETVLVKSDMDVTVDGYKFNYEISDGSARDESAIVKNAGTDEEIISIRGWYRWVSPEGEEFKVNYVADENGFQPEGIHLPKA